MYTACTTAAVLNSCNAAASSRTSRADDREYVYDLFYSLLEEGRRNPHRPALADDDAAAGGGGCCPLGPAWKIAIRSFIAVALLVAEAFLVSLALPICKSWSEAFVWLASVVMIAMAAALMWSLTLDSCIDPEYHRKRRTHS